MTSSRIEMNDRWLRRLAITLAGAIVALLVITPAGAHVGGTVAHVWGHLKSKVTALVYTKTQSDAKFLGKTQKAADSDQLDGHDSTEFLAATAKAADADKLDGLDSTELARKAEPTRILHMPGGIIFFNDGADGEWCSWFHFVADHTSAGYFKDSDDVVHLQGVVKATDGTSSQCGAKLQDNVIFTLPAGYVPASKHVFLVIAGENPVQVNVLANGDVQLHTGFSGDVWSFAESYLQLDGIEFRVEQGS
jgi:hypothetical protein